MPACVHPALHFRHSGTVPSFLGDILALADTLEAASDGAGRGAHVHSRRGNTSRQRAILLDMKETEGAVEVRADIPGVRKEDIHVGIEKHVLTLKVDHEESKQEEGGGADEEGEGKEGQPAPPTWHRTERSRMFVQRCVKLPETADAAQASASYSDGVLAITFPKKALEDTTARLTIQ